MENKIINKTNLLQDIAIEYFALKPSCTVKEGSEKLKIPLRTLYQWRNDPNFGDAVWKRAVIEYSLELPAVLKSAIKEGKNGNVQAQRLVFEQFGKLVKNNVNIIISPFEQFIESNSINNKKSKEVKFEEIPDIKPEDIEVVKKTPNKKGRIKEEKGRNFKEMQKQLAKHKRNLKQKEWYRWKKRAKAVGIASMKGRRPTPIQRKEWEESVIAKEKELGDSEN